MKLYCMRVMTAAAYRFNANAPIGRVLYAQVATVLDRVTGNCQIVVPALTPAVSIAAPQGTTHFRCIACAAETVGRCH